MRFRFLTAAVAAALTASLLAAAGAVAATEVGNRCEANEDAGGATLISLENGPGNPLPARIPSAGVISRWSFSLGLPQPPGSPPLTETLQVFRSTAASNQFQVVGESAPEVVDQGTRTFSTRIPVQAGDLLGAVGASNGLTGTVYCVTGNPGDRVGVVEGGPPPVGSTVTTAGEEKELQNPVVVFVEPDADNDGFGDETQDACPQSATTQTACPVVTLSTTKQVRKGSVVIVVTASTAAPVTVKGVVKLGKGKKAKLNGGTKNLTPGILGKFTLKFTKKVKAKLAQLSPKQKLTLKATVTGTNVAGQVTKKILKVKLKGQAK